MILCTICNGSGIMRTFELALAPTPIPTPACGTGPAPVVVEAPCPNCGGSGAFNPRAARDLLEAWGWLR